MYRDRILNMTYRHLTTTCIFISPPSPFPTTLEAAAPGFLKLLFLGLICLSPSFNPLLVIEADMADGGRLFGILLGGGIAIEAVDAALGIPARADDDDGLRDMSTRGLWRYEREKRS